MSNVHDKNIKLIYDKLTSKGVDMGTLEETTKALRSDPRNGRLLYDMGTKHGYDMGSYEEFEEAMGLPKFQAPLLYDEEPIEVNSAQPKAEEPKQEDDYLTSDMPEEVEPEEEYDFDREVLKDYVPQFKNEIKEKFPNARLYGFSKPVQLGGPGMSYVGEEAYIPMEDRQRMNTLSEQLKLGQITKEQYENEEKAIRQKAVDKMNEQFSEDTLNASAALHLMNQAQKRVKLVDGRTKSNIVNTFRGVGHFDYAGLNPALQFIDAYRSFALLNKVAENPDAELSESEQYLLQAIVTNNTVNDTFQTNMAERIGQGLPESMAFMAQFVLTGGVGSAVGKLAKEGVEKGTEKTIEYLIKKGIKNAERRLYDDGFKGLLQKGIDRTVNTVIPGVVGATTAAATQTILNPASLASGTYERAAGTAEYTLAPDGTPIATGEVTGRMGLGEAFAKEFGAQTIEQLSERAGASLGIATGAGKAVVKTTGKAIASKVPGVQKAADAFVEFADNMKKTKVGDLVGKAAEWLENKDLGVKALAQKVGWNGTVEEWYEEQANTLLNAMFVGDEELSALFNGERQLETFLSVAVVGGATRLLSAPAAIEQRAEVRKEKQNLKNTISDIEKRVQGNSALSNALKAVATAVDTGTVGDVAIAINEANRQLNLDTDTKRMFLDYASARMMSNMWHSNDRRQASKLAEGVYAEVEARTHKQSGTITVAEYTDKDGNKQNVDIIDGVIIRDGAEKIDSTLSDRSVVVRFQDGTTQMVPSKSLGNIVEEIDPALYRAVLAEANTFGTKATYDSEYSARTNEHGVYYKEDGSLDYYHATPGQTALSLIDELGSAEAAAEYAANQLIGLQGEGMSIEAQNALSKWQAVSGLLADITAYNAQQAAAAEGKAPEGTEPMENPLPVDAAAPARNLRTGDRLRLTVDNGEMAEATIGSKTADGNYLVDFDDTVTIGGKKGVSHELTPEVIAAMQYVEEVQEGDAELQAEQTPEQDDVTSYKDMAIGRIPMKADGSRNWEAATPSDAAQAINAERDGDFDASIAFAQQMAQNCANAVAELTNAELEVEDPTNADMVAAAEAQRAQAIASRQKTADFWSEVTNILNTANTERTKPAEQEAPVEEETPTPEDAMPMIDEDTPDFVSAGPERSAEFLSEQFGDDAESFIQDNIAEAQKALADAQGKKPKSINFAERKKENEAIAQEKVVATAALDFWNAVGAAYAARQSTVAEEVAQPEVVESAEQPATAVEEQPAEEVAQPDVVGETAPEKKVLQQKIQEWLSEDNIAWAEGKTLDESIEKFGNETEPIAVLPDIIKNVFPELKSLYLYSGKGYLIDHAANHHPELEVEDYNKIQEVLDSYDDIKDLSTPNVKKIAFVKMMDKGFAVVTELSEKDGRIMLHKTFFYKDAQGKRTPYRNKPSVLKKTSVDGSTTISPAETAAGRHRKISALDASTDKTTTSEPKNQISEQENVEVAEETAATQPEQVVEETTPAESDKQPEQEPQRDNLEEAVANQGYIERKPAKSKFSVWEFVAGKEVRPSAKIPTVLEGVYYDKGFRVATDGRVLVKEKNTAYPAEYEGTARMRDGARTDEGVKYPPYERVIPAYKQADSRKIDFADLLGFLNAVKERVTAEHKATNQHRSLSAALNNTPISMRLANGQVVSFSLAKLMKFALAAKQIGADRVYGDDWTRAILAKNKNGELALLIPVRPDVYPFEGSTRYYYAPELETKPEPNKAPTEVAEETTVTNVQTAPTEEAAEKENAPAEQPEEPTPTAKEDATTKIEDFGEKIGGARKDVARQRIKDSMAYSRTDLVNLKDPDKILSRANIIKYVREGEMTIQDATTLLALNMAVRGEDLRKGLWLEKYRDAAFAWSKGQDVVVEVTDKDVDEVVESLGERARQRANIRQVVREGLELTLGTYTDYKTTYEALNYPEVNRMMKSVYIRVGRHDGKYWVVASPKASRGWPYATMSQAVAKMQVVCPVIPEEDSSKGKEGKDGKDKIGHLHIVKDERGYYRIKSRNIPGSIYLSKRFNSKKVAEQFLKDNAQELVQREIMMTAALMGSNIGMVERQGPDYRNGRDVTPQDFLDTFGVRGVEFGNWVPQAERQLYLNKSYDAIMDLCKVVGISPKAFSLGGRLALAFGSRGKSRALAHYEPLKEVINLTRMKGAGSLAHEWFHALDNYLSRQVNGNVGSMTTRDFRTQRSEVAQEFRNFVHKMGELAYSRRSSLAGPYWYEVWERAARLFESYVYNKLAEQNIESPLLVREDSLYDESNPLMGESGQSAWPYPSAEENEEIKPFFDNLFGTIQEREENGKAVLYQIEDSDLNTAEAKMSTEEVLDLVKAAGIEVEIATPEMVEEMLEMQNALMEAKMKSVPETASVREEHQPTVVSSTDGAKVLNNLDNLQKEYQEKSNASKTFIGDIAQAIGAKREKSNSEYATFEAVNGNIVTIRLSDHSATTKNFDIHNETEGISLVISAQPVEGVDNTEGKAHIVEFYYNSIELRRAEGKPLVDIIKSIKQALYSGEYTDNTGLAKRQEVNEPQWLRTTEGEVYGWVANGKIYLTEKGLNPETPIHEYTHIWDAVCQRENPKLWAEGVALMKQTPLWEQVRTNPAYADIADNEDALASEVHARLAAPGGTAVLVEMMEQQKAEATLIGRIHNWLRKFWRWLRKKEMPESKLNVDKFARMPLKDLAMGKRLLDGIAAANGKQKVAGQEIMDAFGDVPMAQIGRRRQEEMYAILAKRRQDLPDAEKLAVIAELDKLGNNKLVNAAFHYFVNGTVRLPEDMPKVEQAVKVAEIAKVDPAAYKSPMELINAHADVKLKEARIDPDTVSTLSNKVEYEDGLAVYDVEESEESRQNMRRIINTHFGEDSSPWCLLQGDGEGNLTGDSARYWDHYNAQPKRVAFQNGKLLAFFASDGEPTWWDRKDAPHEGIPATRKLPDNSGRVGTVEFDEEMQDWGDYTDIHLGKQGDKIYEEWIDEDTIDFREIREGDTIYHYSFDIEGMITTYMEKNVSGSSFPKRSAIWNEGNVESVTDENGTIYDFSRGNLERIQSRGKTIYEDSHVYWAYDGLLRDVSETTEKGNKRVWFDKFEDVERVEVSNANGIITFNMQRYTNGEMTSASMLDENGVRTFVSFDTGGGVRQYRVGDDVAFMHGNEILEVTAGMMDLAPLQILVQADKVKKDIEQRVSEYAEWAKQYAAEQAQAAESVREPYANPEDFERQMNEQLTAATTKGNLRYRSKAPMSLEEKKRQTEEDFGGIWIEDREEYAKFVAATTLNAFEHKGEGVTYTDNYFYAYYRNASGEAVPFVSVYLNEYESQDVVNYVKDEIENDERGNEQTIRETIAKRFGSDPDTGYGIDGRDGSVSSASRDGILGGHLLRKGRYADAPELFRKGKRAYRTKAEYTDSQRAIAAQAQTLSTAEIEEYINEVAKSLPEGVKVVVTNSVESGDREHTGWYDMGTDTVYINADMCDNTADVDATIVHELVGHRSMPTAIARVIGRTNATDRIALYTKLATMLPKELLDRVMAKTAADMDLGVAVDEVLAEAVENADLIKPSVWQRICSEVRAFFRRVFNRGISLSDGDIKYMFWLAAHNINNDAEFVAAEGILHRLGAGRFKRNSALPTEEQQEYDSAVISKSQQFVEEWVDSLNPLKKLQETVAKHHGELKSWENAYDIELGRASRTMARFNMMSERFLKPIITAISAFTNNGISREEVMNYMIAKHGLERNEYARRQAHQELNKSILDAVKEVATSEEYAGLSDVEKASVVKSMFADYLDHLNSDEIVRALEFFASSPDTDFIGIVVALEAVPLEDVSGLTGLAEKLSDDPDAKPGEIFTEFAESLVEEFESENEEAVNTLWDKVRDLTNATLLYQTEGGILSQEQYQHLRSMYRYYIPLRGWDGPNSRDYYEYSTSPARFQTVVKAAKGRKSLAEDPLANMANMLQSAVTIVEKNASKQAFVRMALNRSDSSVVRVVKVRYEKRKNASTGKTEWVAVFPDFNQDASSAEIDAAIAGFDEQTKQLVAEGEARVRRSQVDVGVKVLPANLNDHYVKAMINGEEVAVIVNGSPAAALALNGTNVPSYDEALQDTIGKATRFFARTHTTWAPKFVVTNFLRDYGYGSLTALTRYGTKYAMSFQKNIARSMWLLPKMLKNGISQLSEEQLEDFSKIDRQTLRYFVEFLTNGGETGFSQSLTTEEWKKEIEKQIKALNGKDTKNAVKALLSLLDSANRYAEDIPRFAAYLTSRERGKDISDSIKDAKEITVNFSRHGAGGMGNSFVRKSYAFVNAGIQGLYNLTTLAKEHPKRFYPTMATIFLTGFGLPFLNILLISAFGDDDDERNYKYMSEFNNTNRLVLFNPFGKEKGFITLPISHELVPFYGLGNIFSRRLMGYDADISLSGQIATTIMSAMPLDFISASAQGVSLRSFIPSVAQPIYDVFQNRDFMGRPIYRSYDFGNGNSNRGDAAFTKAPIDTWEWLVWLSKQTSRLTGGDGIIMPGLSDFHISDKDADVQISNPAIAQYLLESYLGGALQSASKVVNLGKGLVAKMTDDETRAEEYLAAYNLPLISGLYRFSNETSANSRIKEAYDHYKNNISKQCERAVKTYMEELPSDLNLWPKAAIDVLNSTDYQIYQLFKDYDKPIRKAEKLLNEAYDRKAPKAEIDELKRVIMAAKMELIEAASDIQLRGVATKMQDNN